MTAARSTAPAWANVLTPSLTPAAGPAAHLDNRQRPYEEDIVRKLIIPLAAAAAITTAASPARRWVMWCAAVIGRRWS